MAKRQYSDNDKATALAALDANSGNLKLTARELGIPASTLQRWRDGQVNDDVTVLRTYKKDELAERLVEIAHQLIDAAPDKVKGANLQQIFTSLGIAIEKIQLLEGEPTERSEVIDPLDDNTRATRIAALLDAARNRRDRQDGEAG